MRKAFTLIELVVAVALLAMVISFSGVIFRVSIESHRGARANAEIMQKLRAITDQLNNDFKGLQKDGYLLLRSEKSSRPEFEGLPNSDFRADRIYYFCTGDFQSWFATNIRSNIARVYFGHDSSSLAGGYQSECKLARDVRLLTPETVIPPPPPIVDYNNISYAQCKVNLPDFEDANELVTVGVPTDPPDNHRSLLSENAGSVEIEWTDGSTVGGELNWWGMPSGSIPGSVYKAEWTPINNAPWPKALRFTFTLYDSKGVMKPGRRFTHIVYLGD